MRVNVDEYKGLEEFSFPTSNVNLFMPVFITGVAREGQEYGKLQIGDINKTLFLNNATRVYFIPMFIHQIWTKHITETNEKGEKIDRLVDFSWDSKIKPKPANDSLCKYSYIIAGLYLDEKTKKRASHPYTEDKDAVIYFNCKGIKVGCALDFNNLLDSSINEYMSRRDFKALTGNEQGSYDYDREKALCGFRRLICNVSVDYGDSNFGKKHVFKFSVEKEKTDSGEKTKVISAEATKQFLDMCKTYQRDFVNQFDKTNKIKDYSYSNVTQENSNPAFGSETTLESSLDKELKLSEKEKEKEVKLEPQVQQKSVESESEAFDFNFNL